MKTIARLLVICLLMSNGMNAHAQSDKTVAPIIALNAADHISPSAATRMYNSLIIERTFNPKCSGFTFDVVKQSLHEDEIVIETFLQEKDSGENRYIAFTIRKNYDAPHICDLFSEDSLNSLLEKGITLFSDTIVASILLEPLNKELTGVSTIFFTPAGKLHLFPIEYCKVDNDIMLAEKYNFFRLTSSAIIPTRNKKHEKYKSYAIYAGVDINSLPDFEEEYNDDVSKCGYGYLHYSYTAACDIHDYLSNKGIQGRLYANEEATESSFKSLSSQPVELLLIETHGANNPSIDVDVSPNSLMFACSSYVMEGGIVPEGKEDGLLTYDEISKLDLSNIDFAVISACQSGLGKIDRQGVNGLMRAFKTAGVNSLIMATDFIVDYVAGEVWKSLFREIERGKSKRESLLIALKHLELIDNGFYSSPKYWAAFILLDGLD